MHLNVSDIQHFSLGDGPGIRSTVFLKGCNLHCPWCHNPESVSPAPQVLNYVKAGKAVSYGHRLSVEEILQEVLQDEEFYRQSGGGVTVSGGEPLLQAEAVAELCRALNLKNVHTLIDTAGNVPWKSFEAVLDYTDCFYFDWKTPSAEVYRTVIGGNLALIESNLKLLLINNKSVHVRMPIIPGINDRRSDIEKSTALLSKIGVKNVDLLPFHRLGSGKYEAMGIPYSYAKMPPHSKEEIERIAEAYRSYFAVTIEN